VAEAGAGRLAEITVNGAKAEVKVLKEGLSGPVAVTLTGGMAYVAEGQLSLLNDRSKEPAPFRVVGVPYKAGR
jgi:hypothetical protein